MKPWVIKFSTFIQFVILENLLTLDLALSGVKELNYMGLSKISSLSLEHKTTVILFDSC